VFAPRRPSAPPRPGVGHPVSPAGNSEEATGSPKFLGNLHCPFARVLTDAGRTAHTRRLRCSSVAPGPPGAKAPTIGLSTPNSTAFGLAVYASQGRLLRPTQDSLPVAGQALPDGLSTHKIPMRGFKIVSLHLYPPLPSFAWRNGGDRCGFPSDEFFGKDGSCFRKNSAKLVPPRPNSCFRPSHWVGYEAAWPFTGRGVAERVELGFPSRRGSTRGGARRRSDLVGHR
jgi:hypothetical protein